MSSAHQALYDDYESLLKLNIKKMLEAVSNTIKYQSKVADELKSHVQELEKEKLDAEVIHRMKLRAELEEEELEAEVETVKNRLNSCIEELEKKRLEAKLVQGLKLRVEELENEKLKWEMENNKLKSRIKKANKEKFMMTIGLKLHIEVANKELKLHNAKLKKTKIEEQVVAAEEKISCIDWLGKKKLMAEVTTKRLKMECARLETEKLEAEAATEGLKLQIQESDKEKLEAVAATKLLTSKIEELEMEKQNSEVVTNVLKSHIKEIEVMIRNDEMEERMLKSGIKELEEKNSASRLERAKLEKAESEINTWKMAAEKFSDEIYNLENQMKLCKEEKNMLKLQLVYLKDMILSMEEADREVKSELSDRQNRCSELEEAAEYYSVQICDLERRLQYQIESKNKIITSLKEEYKEVGAQVSENMDHLVGCFRKTCADLRESNIKLKAFECFQGVALHMVQATLERIVKTDKSLMEDKMVGDMFESLSSEEIKEKAVAFLDGLMAIEEVFWCKEDKIKELEKELLLFHEDWLVVKDLSFV